MQETARLPSEPVYLRGDDRSAPQHWSGQRQAGYDPLPQPRNWDAPTLNDYRGGTPMATQVPPNATYRTEPARSPALAQHSGSAAGRWIESPRGQSYPSSPDRAAAPDRWQPSRPAQAAAAPDYRETRYGAARAGGPVGASQPFMVQVRAGDTLFGLAQRHGVSVHELMAANNLPNSRIEIGQVLLLPNR